MEVDGRGQPHLPGTPQAARALGQKHDTRQLSIPRTGPPRLRSVSTNEGADLIVISDKAKKQIAAFGQKQNSQVQAGAKLEIFSKRTDAKAGMPMRMAKGRSQPGYHCVDCGLLLRGQRVQRPFVARPGVDHGFQAFNRPAFRSFLMAAKSRSAHNSTSSGVTLYSSKGEAVPTKKFQTAS